MKINRTFFYRILIVTITTLFLTSCATNLSKPTKLSKPTTVRFNKFQNVEMKAVELDENFASSDANQKALVKIDELLFRDIKMVFPNLKRIELSENFSDSAERTLQITPYIKEIKFVGGAARFWAGAMAGSSAVLMEVTFRDSSTGKVIADPEFFERGDAWSGGWSIGTTDNLMLNEVAKEITEYCSLSK
ncbi:MAG: hypothetical protein K9L30_07095 [Desulfobacterales bacterium]|nr:hypothetical protein [Desulfobacterales bacterium]